MNRINPIHIAVLLIVLLVFFAIKLNSVKSELLEAKEQYSETLELSTKLKGLNDTYSSKADVVKSLNRILKQSSFKLANIKKKIGKTSIVISSENMSKQALNSLMSKLLNGIYNISSLKIKKLSTKKASIKVEIKW